MTKVVNPAVDIPLPGGYVMPTIRPLFDYVTLIRILMRSKLAKNKFDGEDPGDLYKLAQIMPGKVSQDALLQFSDDYFAPAARIAQRVMVVDNHRQNMLNGIHYQMRNINTASEDTAAHDPILQTILGEIDPNSIEARPTKVAAVTRQKLARISNFLKSRKYRKQTYSFSDVLSFIEFEPTRQTKNRKEHYPAVSILVTPNKNFVFDVFVGGDRLATFDYGLPRYNQITAPPSMLKDSYAGSLTDKEFFQYKIGLEKAVAEIERIYRESKMDAVRTKDPKIKSAF